MTRILGILNLTRDSFSDGGRYLEPDAALAHARQMLRHGADIIDLGAESTHPDAEDVPAEVEIERITPVLRALKAAGARVSVDTHKPAVMRAVLRLGAQMINDVSGMRTPEAIAAVCESDAQVVVMHSRAAGARAERSEADPNTLVQEILAFFADRVAALAAAGVARERIILDPGMGFFLGSNPESSLRVLREFDRFREIGCPLLVSTSRKSFLGAILADGETPRPAAQRGAATLASELWAALQGVDYIRTHDVRPLCDALRVLDAIRYDSHSAGPDAVRSEAARGHGGT